MSKSKHRLHCVLSLAFTLTCCYGFAARPVHFASGCGKPFPSDTVRADRQFVLESTMLGYFAPDGTRNPTLRARKGEVVRIKIINGELMTHDIALEKAGIKSKVILPKGDSTSITFTAKENDTYYCSVPGHRTAGMVGKFEVTEGEVETRTIAGELPQVANSGGGSRSLNFNFESGDLTGWTATGEAFNNAILRDDPSPVHAPDMHIGFEGNYFISSGGIKNAALKGTLTSVPFKVTKPFAAFRVSGGALADTRVELVSAKDGKVIYKTTGQGRATLQPVVADLTRFLNQEIFIRLIDNETGLSPIPYIHPDGWAHINFDDFRLYPSRPSFPNELKKEDIIVLPPLDPVLHAGLSGKEAARAMTLTKDFRITLAASEPDVVRPISFTIDARGRLWVAEGHTYPVPAPPGQGKDRILIFEDTNGDGTLDKRSVFMENLNLVSGIEIGMGGLWIGAAPYLMFVPTNSETDKPAGPPQILLDGWGVHDTHEVLNNLRWGPDGWLYGTHGVFTHSNVGKPGTPDSLRQKINAGVWRYHPTRHTFEVFAEGSSNPWGIDFNDYGHAFITVCVIPHLYHVIQGARYQRQAGNHFNPYTYDDIKTIADHVHWVGDRGPHAGNFRSASKGGGHAHAGAMIYLGGNSWPAAYRNDIFMNNINGSKLNVDHPVRKGSGYTATHKKDFLSMNDAWSQWLNMRYDQNGSVYAIDWYDQNQCHSPNPDVHDKTMGRIFKITYQKDKWTPVDLARLPGQKLAELQLHPNEWFVRHARMILQERGADEEARRILKKILNTNPDETRQLRALWTLHATDALTESELAALLRRPGEYVRSWAIQLLAEKKSVTPEVLAAFERMARQDKSPLVRLYLASAGLRLPPAQRWKIAEALMKHAEDSNDHNLPLMVWYLAEPLAALDPGKALKMAEASALPKILDYTVQRIAALKNAEAKQLLQTLKEKLAHDHQRHETAMLLDRLLPTL